MRALGFVLVVLLDICLTRTEGAFWSKSQTFFKSLKHILGDRIERDGSCGKSRPRLSRWWRTRVETGNVDGVPEDADNEAYLGALKCRIWLAVCNIETDPNNRSQWQQIRRQLWSLKRLIWKSDGENIAGGRRNWARWWLATYLETRAAAKADLAGKCSEWRDKCNVDDGDATDPGPGVSEPDPDPEEQGGHSESEDSKEGRNGPGHGQGNGKTDNTIPPSPFVF